MKDKWKCHISLQMFASCRKLLDRVGQASPAGTTTTRRENVNTSYMAVAKETATGSRIRRRVRRSAWKKVRYEPRREKSWLRGFRPGPTQTRLYNHRRWVEA